MTGSPLLRLRASLGILSAILFCGAPVTASGHEIELASIEVARSVLGTRDDFVARLSPFDRAARMRLAEDPGEARFLEFTRAAARDWTADERARLSSAFAAIEPMLAALLPELDAPILLIKTSGEEEGGAGYTRGTAVFLPQAMTDGRELQRVLAHEIFHVASRAHPSLKQALYGVIGFEPCGEVVLPAALAARKMTNPDAPANDYCIELQVDGGSAWGMPILLARQERYDPATGVPFFGYLTLSMLLVEREGGGARPRERDGAPVLVPFNRVQGFLEQVGRNTNYVIHAEEILASNFERLVLGESNAPSPEVLTRIRAVLERSVGP